MVLFSMKPSPGRCTGWPPCSPTEPAGAVFRRSRREGPDRVRPRGTLAIRGGSPYPVAPGAPREPMATPPNVTTLLGEWSRGNEGALNQLLPLVYAELRRMAARQLRTERSNHTLQPTALVHEVYLRLVDQRHVDWQDRAHFLGVAARVMRRILVDHARRHGARKRGDGVQCVSIDDAKELAAAQEMPLLAQEHAVGRLQEVEPARALRVPLRA